MKMTARILAIALACLLLLSVIPMHALAAENTYVLDASSLPAIAKGEAGDGESIEGGTDNYFTIFLSAKAQIHSNEKLFEDGFSCTQRLHYGASTKFEDGVLNAIMFKTSGPATVKIWWGCGDVGREIGIYNGAGEILSQTNAGLEKNALCISTLEIAEAGTYFIGNVGGNNYHYKVEVTEQPAEAAPAIVSVEDGQYIISWGDLTFAALAEDKTYGYAPAGSAAAPADTDIITITNTADGKFTMQDSYGRYIYMKGTYNSFNVGPEAIEACEWILEDAGNGVVHLKNVGMEKYVSYAEKFSTWGSYADQYESGNLSIAPVAAEEPTEPAPTEPAPTEPVIPEEPSDTGDAIGAVVALLAISGATLVVLKKKEN